MDFMTKQEEKPTGATDPLEEAKRIMRETGEELVTRDKKRFEEAALLAKETWGDNVDVYGVWGHLKASGAIEYMLFQEKTGEDQYRYFVITGKDDQGWLRTSDVDIANPPGNTRVISKAEYLGRDS